jgi:transcriptional regulator with XRE-family HTH domain
MSISERIEAYLKAKGLRPVELARQTGVPQSAISEMLTGVRGNPGLKYLEAFILKTDMSAHYLLTGQGDPVRMEPKPGHALTPESITELFARVDDVLGTGGLAPAQKKRLMALALCEHADGKSVGEVIRWMQGVLAAGDNLRAA